MYDDVVFADRFRYPLAMFNNRVLTRLSRIRHAHISCVKDTAKIVAALCRISYCWYDFIRFNSIAFRAQTTRYTMMKLSLIDSDIHLLYLMVVC